MSNNCGFDKLAARMTLNSSISKCEKIGLLKNNAKL